MFFYKKIIKITTKRNVKISSQFIGNPIVFYGQKRTVLQEFISK